MRVRGESRIELGVTHVEVGVSITGALRDELGAPLSGRLLALEAVPLSSPGEPWRMQLTTDAEGRFSLEIADPEHDYRLLATFSGDETHRGVRVERRVERARSDVRLELRLPFGHTIDLDAPELVVEAIAESDVGGNGVAMRLWDEGGRELGRGTTDKSGHLRVRVPTSRMGPPGAGLVRIESLRDPLRAEAQTEARVVRKRAVYVDLRVSAKEIEAGQPAQLGGRAYTHAGPTGSEPRVAIPVGLFLGERHLATVMTNDKGEFASELWVDVEQGPLEIMARTEGDATGAYPPAEARASLRVSPARPVPFAWLIGASLCVALAAFLAGRRRTRSTVEAEEPERVREPTEPSISPARAHGKRDRHKVGGRVIDLRGDRGLPDAEIAIQHSQAEASCVLRSDLNGRFESPELPNGKAHLLITAAGYVRSELDLELPHRGEWSSVLIRLESLRARALAAFRTLAFRTLPSPRAWGIWTTREAREWISERAPEQRSTIRKLTGEVERACYAREQPDAEAVASIEQIASAVAAELRTRPQVQVANSERERRTLR
ncbi:MAG: hypothetical protein JWN48_5780 [Myxococcaceae bacterium]|nr:hypothetical protein [Myxococcaceae bacterium]